MGKYAASLFVVLAVILVSCGAETETIVETPAVEIEPTLVPPTKTPIPPTNTLMPPTDTPMPPTDTPVPPTDTPIPPTPPPTATHGPTPCDDIDGACMFLRFDGETCAYVGPKELQPGPTTIVYHNDGPSSSLGSLVLLTDGRTMEDVIAFQGWGPYSGRGPRWQEPVAGWNTRAGESFTWEGVIEEGEYYLACIRIVPDGVWVGGGLIVTD